MVQAILKISARPHRTAELVEAFRSIMVPAQAEAGLISCQLYNQVGDASVLYYVEQWRTPEDLNRQIRSSRYTRIFALMETAAEAPSLEFQFVSETRGLEHVESVRW